MTARLNDLARDGAARLSAAGIDNAAREARLLLAYASGLSAARLGVEMDAVAAPDTVQRFKAALTRRCAREPMSHITGRRLFFNHEFSVTPDVLDPRAETETLVLAALSRDFARVLDLGTGSGAILLSLLAERSGAVGTGTDISDAALAIARENAARLGLMERCHLMRSDWFGDVAGQFDLIVSNPPYIGEVEMPDLAPELSYEPRMALTDGGDGLSAYRAICAGVRAHLVANGWLMVEIGWKQGGDVAALFEQAGLVDVGVLPDLDGRDRVVQGRAPA